MIGRCREGGVGGVGRFGRADRGWEEYERGLQKKLD